MTGEVTLRGLVSADRRVEGKEPCGDARRDQTRASFPKLNEKDLVDIPEEVKQKINFIPVENVDEVLANALEAKSASAPS